jgi:predicted ABC-type transport system involved in lysophospholipase L1 biosynthesis ATPase subunit
MSEPPDAIVSAHELTRRYGDGEAEVNALGGVSVAFPPARFAAIMGASGSGKSTLMHLLAGLDRPTSGTVTLAGTVLGGLDDNALTLAARPRRIRLSELQPALDARRAREHPVAARDRGQTRRSGMV